MGRDGQFLKPIEREDEKGVRREVVRGAPPPRGFAHFFHFPLPQQPHDLSGRA